MTKQFECGICLTPFIYSKQHKKYCSKACCKIGQIEKQRLWYQNKHPHPPKKCRICHTSIPEASKQQTLCSDLCKKVAERQRSKQRQLANPEKLRSQSRLWYLNNVEKHRESNRKSAKKRRSRPGVKKREMLNARARRNGAKSYLITQRDENRMLRRQSHHCYYCGSKIEQINMTLDHVIPLSKGGVNGISNLVIACKSCNSSKNNLFLMAWKIRRRKEPHQQRLVF